MLTFGDVAFGSGRAGRVRCNSAGRQYVVRGERNKKAPVHTDKPVLRVYSWSGLISRLRGDVVQAAGFLIPLPRFGLLALIQAPLVILFDSLD